MLSVYTCQNGQFPKSMYQLIVTYCLIGSGIKVACTLYKLDKYGSHLQKATSNKCIRMCSRRTLSRQAKAIKRLF